MIQTDTYHALSSCAQDSALCLSKLDLKLPLQELVTASQGEQLKRQKELVYRLGFDALQRHLAISDAYMPVQNIKKSFLNEGFVAFCQWTARKKGFEIPEHEEIANFEKEGRRRALEVNKMEIVRAWFKRPLEIWLALDRAVLLEENGYQVSLSVFCERQLTPRNLLILASRYE